MLDETELFWEKGAILENVTDNGIILPVSSVIVVEKPQNDSAS